MDSNRITNPQLGIASQSLEVYSKTVVSQLLKSLENTLGAPTTNLIVHRRCSEQVCVPAFSAHVRSIDSDKHILMTKLLNQADVTCTIKISDTCVDNWTESTVQPSGVFRTIDRQVSFNVQTTDLTNVQCFTRTLRCKVTLVQRVYPFIVSSHSSCTHQHSQLTMNRACLRSKH
jgi:hypothetical protein